MSILKFASTINKITGNNAGIQFEPSSRLGDDPQRRQPDISRAKKILNWSPLVPMDEGVRKTIPYFKQKMGVE